MPCACRVREDGGEEGARGRPEPDERRATDLDGRLEDVGAERAQARVEPVGGDHEIGLGDGLDLLLEREDHAERFGATAEDRQELHPRDPGEAVAGRADLRLADDDIDVAPVSERAGDLAVRRGIGALELGQRLVGEHDPPAERVVGAVALDHADRPARLRLLQEQGQVEPTGARADDGDIEGVHDPCSVRSLPRSILPRWVRGKVSRNTIRRGTL